MDDGEIVEGVDEDIALRVIVRAEPLGSGKEALEVDVLVHEDVSNEWAIGMLRQIADDLESQVHGAVGEE